MSSFLPKDESPIRISLSVIGGKWKPLILWHIKENPRRFSELQRCIPGITQMMLTKQLRELESDMIIIRTMYPEIPPRVDYRLTDLGKTVFPVLCALYSWGKTYQDEIQHNTSNSESK